MQAQLNTLEIKLAQLIQLAQRLREENHKLRQELVNALSQDRKSTDKISVARIRLEHLLSKLPDDQTHEGG